MRAGLGWIFDKEHEAHSPKPSRLAVLEQRQHRPIWHWGSVSAIDQTARPCTAPHRESLVDFVQFFISSFGIPRCTPSMNQSAIFRTLETSKRTFRELVMLDPSYVYVYSCTPGCAV